ncbi:uncharacterized protein LOC121376805 [Gigantopelta aegis]|uniref:uncharacterized protein LOC121376805 n=1 Tax=Gigantopelta aegis TaxID=1735272 RepID=UPI001B88C0EF|nr:uncharacterized protein LOC121376805 [Gigantopelta aegis]
MRNAILALVLLVGLVATVNCNCVTETAQACIATQTSELASSGFDIGGKCSAFKNFINCISEAGCISEASYKTPVDTAKSFISTFCNSGTMVTVSVLTLFLTLSAVAF